MKYLFFRGRAGLAAILSALNLNRGDEVITQAFTCVAVPEGIMAVGATPIFTDLREGSVNVDPAALAVQITPRTRAIIVQHTFGYAGPVNEVASIVKGKDIAIIEDCCHTFSTAVGDRRVGSIGDAAFYSFEWGKPLPCGVGGAVTSNNPEICESIEKQQAALREPGFVRRLRLELQYRGFEFFYRPGTYWTVKAIFNALSRAGAAEGNFGDLDFSRPSTDFELAMSPSVVRRVTRRLKSIPDISSHANRVVEGYRSITLPSDISRVLDDTADGSVLARYPLWARRKQDLLEKAKLHNIELADWYKTPVHPLDSAEQAAVNYVSGSCPVAEAACEQIVSLPTNRYVNDKILGKTEAFFAA